MWHVAGPSFSLLVLLVSDFDQWNSCQLSDLLTRNSFAISVLQCHSVQTLFILIDIGDAQSQTEADGKSCYNHWPKTFYKEAVTDSHFVLHLVLSKCLMTEQLSSRVSCRFFCFMQVCVGTEKSRKRPKIDLCQNSTLTTICFFIHPGCVVKQLLSFGWPV